MKVGSVAWWKAACKAMTTFNARFGSNSSSIIDFKSIVEFLKMSITVSGVCWIYVKINGDFVCGVLIAHSTWQECSAAVLVHYLQVGL